MTFDGDIGEGRPQQVARRSAVPMQNGARMASAAQSPISSPSRSTIAA